MSEKDAEVNVTELILPVYVKANYKQEVKGFERKLSKAYIVHLHKLHVFRRTDEWCLVTAAMGKQPMRDLYNSKVSSAEYVTRPLGDKDVKKNVPFAHHAGVRVTTSSGDKYLVHKGPSYGRSSDTVVTPASNMSDRWKTTGSKPVSSSTVGDFVKHGQPDTSYNLLTSNCQHAANSMWNKTK